MGENIHYNDVSQGIQTVKDPIIKLKTDIEIDEAKDHKGEVKSAYNQNSIVNIGLRALMVSNPTISAPMSGIDRLLLGMA